jgi:hypothetical protein
MKFGRRLPSSSASAHDCGSFEEPQALANTSTLKSIAKMVRDRFVVRMTR